MLHPVRSRGVPRRSVNVCAGGRVGSVVVLQLVDDVHVTEHAVFERLPFSAVLWLPEGDP